MTEIERKALALLRECAEVPAYVNLKAIPGFVRAALFRAIEQHEALEAENERLTARVAELEAVLKRCAEIVRLHNNRQNEKVEDVIYLVNAALEDRHD